MKYFLIKEVILFPAMKPLEDQLAAQKSFFKTQNIDPENSIKK